jgi:hypothetical protein
LLLAAPGGATPPTAGDRALLAAADLQRGMPAAFRCELRVEPLAGGSVATFELWRDGDFALVRFRDSRQRGKAFLQRPAGDSQAGTWFLAPHARPVRLSPAQRLAAGVSLQEILGLAYSRDYTLEDAQRQPAGRTELVTFWLRARGTGAPYPRVSYLVRADTRRPLRIEYRLASGKLARLVELAEWQPGPRLVPAVMVAKDLVTGRPPVRIRFLAVETRQPPAHLFELSPAGDAARTALP